MTMTKEIVSPVSILPTVVVRVGQEKFGKDLVRGLCDSGSQPNLITNRLVRRLNLQTQPIKMNITGLSFSPIRITRSIQLKIYPWFDSNKFTELTFWVLPRDAKWHPILPDRIVRPAEIKLVENISLADPLFWKPSGVDLLLGVGACAKIIKSPVVELSDGLVEQQTELGAMILGNLGGSNGISTSRAYSVKNECNLEDIEGLIKKFWEIEELPEVPKKSKEHQLVEKIFAERHTRDENGRFYVPIPINPDVKEIGSSESMARKRFHILERRFEKEPEFKRAYVDFMREYKELGHMIEVDPTIP